MIPKIRTINEAYLEIKAADDKTALSPYYIRQLILNGYIPHIEAGNKYLINMNDLFEYLEHPPKKQPDNFNGIRKIKE